MASRALTKETRKLVSQGASKARKKAQQLASENQLVAAGGGSIGAIVSATVDGGSAETFELMGVTVPTNMATGAVALVAGLWMGKGAAAAGLIGGGATQLNIELYKMIMARKGT